MEKKSFIRAGLDCIARSLHFHYALWNPWYGRIPPIFYIGMTDRHFKEASDNLLTLMTREGNLEPGNKVLEVGCGPGVGALAFMDYLDDSQVATYHGFDVNKRDIRWCRNKYKDYDYLHFKHANVYNGYYNKKGKHKASKFRFPYPDASFHFVVVNSVFTHMMPADVENYLAEIHRVLKTGGTAFISYFILNPEARQLIRRRRNVIDHSFQQDFGTYALMDPNNPEKAIAFHQSYLEELYAKVGLEIQMPFRYGMWSGRPDHDHIEDIIVAVKR